MIERDLMCWNSMFNGDARHVRMNQARSLFEETMERNVILWTIFIDGHVRCSGAKEALEYFQSMLRCGVRPDRVAVVGVVSVRAQLSNLEQGR
jgi:pentatricopeptide repeat protein